MVKNRIVLVLIPLTIVVLAISPAFARSWGCSVRGAREAVVAEDRYVVKRAVSAYTEDLHHPPISLDDLVTSGYLKAVPTDARTHERWNEW